MGGLMVVRYLHEFFKIFHFASYMANIRLKPLSMITSLQICVHLDQFYSRVGFMGKNVIFPVKNALFWSELTFLSIPL